MRQPLSNISLMFIAGLTLLLSNCGANPQQQDTPQEYDTTETTSLKVDNGKLYQISSVGGKTTMNTLASMGEDDVLITREISIDTEAQRGESSEGIIEVAIDIMRKYEEDCKEKPENKECKKYNELGDAKEASILYKEKDGKIIKGLFIPIEEVKE